jgi:tetratricopeptide (TPR) repeat protein
LRAMSPLPLRRLTSLIALALALALTLAPATASARPDYRAANAHGDEGFAAYEAGRWQEAFDAFERAEAAAHSPVFLLYMARSQSLLVRGAQARALYQRIVAESPEPQAPEAFVTAHQDAERELAALKVTGAEPAGGVEAVEAVETLDAVQTEAADVPPTLLTNPPDDGAASRQPANVSGDRAHEHGPAADALAAGPIWPAALTLGLAGVSAIAGGVLGGLALARDDDASTALTSCSDEATCDDAESQRSGALDFAHASTGLFVGASLAATAGVVLLLTREDGSAAVAVQIRPSGLSLRGRF